MSFDWSEYFELAQYLADINSVNSSGSAINPKSRLSEAKLRSSISRAYYAAFCIARNYLRDFLHDPKLLKARNGDLNEHKYVAEEFKHNRAKNKKMIEVGNDLSKLRQYRNKSDYDDRIYSLEKEVQFSLKLAENVISKITELIKNIE